MQTQVYIIRHGESEANRRDAFLGHLDLPLTDTGRKQAAVAAEYLKDTKPDIIYSSDLSRAYDTACCTAKNWDMPVNKDPQLREIDAGAWENVTFSELEVKCPETYGIWLSDVGHSRCDGGESVAELQERIVAAITRIAEAHPGQRVFIFCHGTPIKAFATHCLGLTLDEWSKLPWASNASVTRAVYENGKFTLIEYSRDDFMGDLVTKLPDNV